MKINREELNRLIKESITKTLNESLYTDPVTKWIYWCFNYTEPKEFIAVIAGGENSYLYQHYLSKFNALYERVGADAVMNRFFLELDGEHRQKLLQYVEEAEF
jgi:hypothetical protein